MPIAPSNRYVESTPVSPTDTFDIPFPLFAREDVRVLIDGASVAGFTVLGDFSDGRISNGRIVLTSAVSGVTVRIEGYRNPERTNDYGESAALLTRRIQNDADMLTAVVQEVRRDVTGAVDTVNDALPLIEAVEGHAAAAEAAADRSEAAFAAIDLNGIPIFLGPWASGYSYKRGNVVLVSGTQYSALSDHVSGATFAADQTAGKWVVSLPAGSPGAGTGDMLRAQNLADLPNKPAAVSNLGLSQAALKDVAQSFTQAQTFSAGLKRGLPSVVADLNAADLPDLVRSDNTTLNRPNDFGCLVQTFPYNSTSTLQIAHRLGGDEAFMRRKNIGVWYPWVAIQVGRSLHELIDYRAVSAASEVIFNNFANDARFFGYQLIITEASVSSDDANLLMQFSGDNGATWISSAGAYRWRAGRPAGTDVFSPGSQVIRLNNAGIGSAAGEGFALTVNLHNTDRAPDRSLVEWSGVLTDSAGASELERGSGSRLGAGVSNGIRIYPNAGTFSGKFALIGLRGF